MEKEVTAALILSSSKDEGVAQRRGTTSWFDRLTMRSTGQPLLPGSNDR